VPSKILISIFLLYACAHDFAHANSMFVASYDAYGNFAELKEMEKVIRDIARRNGLEVKAARSPGLPPDPEHWMPDKYLYPLFLIAENFNSSKEGVAFGIATSPDDITILGEISTPRALLVQFVKVLEERFDITFETKIHPSEGSLTPVCGNNRTFVARFDAYENFSMLKKIEDTIRTVAQRNDLKVRVIQSPGLPPEPENTDQSYYMYPVFLIAENFEDAESKRNTGFCIETDTRSLSVLDKAHTSLTLISQFTEELSNQFGIVFDIAPYRGNSSSRSSEGG